MSEIHEGSEVVRGMLGAIVERSDNHGGRWLDGTVHTPAGSVEVSTFLEPGGRWQVVMFRTVVGGRLYRRWERRRCAVTNRGLKTLARRWAAGLAEPAARGAGMSRCTPADPCRRCELWERHAAGAPIADLQPCVYCPDWWGAADLDERTRLCPACRAEILDAVEHEPPEPECDVQELARRVLERRRREYEEARARLAERGGLPGDPLRRAAG